MVDEILHPLRKWRLDQVPKMTLDAAASGVGTFRSVWYDWEIGRRIPQPSFMQKIFLFTRGAVDANSFYFPDGFPDQRQPVLPFDDKDTPLFAAAERRIAA